MVTAWVAIWLASTMKIYTKASQRRLSTKSKNTWSLCRKLPRIKLPVEQFHWGEWRGSTTNIDRRGHMLYVVLSCLVVGCWVNLARKRVTQHKSILQVRQALRGSIRWVKPTPSAGLLGLLFCGCIVSVLFVVFFGAKGANVDDYEELST